MSVVALVPRALVEKKPPHGAPCTRCGLCCMASLCPLAAAVFKRPEAPGPCPALQKDELDPTKYACGLVQEPMRFNARRTLVHGVKKMREAALTLIGGEPAGCDAIFDGEPANLDFRIRLMRWGNDYKQRVQESMRLWGVKLNRERAP
jgi:hypothetical protein